MTKPADKAPTPAYGSFKTMISFLNDIRDTGHIPMQIDRSLMAKLSGSAKGETLSTLRFFGLTNEKDVPTQLFDRFAMASDEMRKEVLPEMVRTAYSFVFSTPDFQIERATGHQVTELFRSQGITGGTVSRAMSLFLSAVKEAGIKVSPSIKPPKSSANGSRLKKERKAIDEASPPLQQRMEDLPPTGTHRFELPIPGKPSVQVLVPDSLDADDWEMLSQMFGIYVNRWKGYQIPKKEPTS